MAQRLYPLQALLSVRHYREDAARNALRLEERRLVQAREEVGRRQAELERYRIWRQEEEERRYAAILGASLSLEAAKIEKHRDIWQENAKREQEHLEDLELEEFATPSRASDDA